MEAVKRFSPAVFGLIIFCFVLPFVNLTCSGQTVMTLTGFQLITGRDFEPDMFNQEGMFGDQGMQNQPASEDGVEPQPMALFAFIAAVLCLVISFFRKKSTALICMIISVSGGIFLLLLKISMDDDVTTSGQGIVQLEYQYGYWFSFLFFIAGTVIQWMMFKEPLGANETPGKPPATL